jgi:hypothetical protein
MDRHALPHLPGEALGHLQIEPQGRDVLDDERRGAVDRRTGIDRDLATRPEIGARNVIVPSRPAPPIARRRRFSATVASVARWPRGLRPPAQER